MLEASNPIFVVSSGGEVIFANSACTRLQGNPAAASPGDSLVRLCGEDLSRHVREVAIPTALEARSHAAEVVVSRGGERVHFSVVATVLGGESCALSVMIHELPSPPLAGPDGPSPASPEHVAHLSHELRAPLSGVIGLSSVLLGGHLDAEQRQCAETIRDCAESLLKILNDLLDFSKLQARRLELDPIDFDLRTSLRYLRRITGVAAGAKGINLDWQVDAAVPRMLRGDPGRLRQILTNLLDNAMKFTVGEVAFAVGVDRQDDRQVVLRFSVRDDGPGIPAASLPTLFLPYVQLAPRRSRTGAGLGLAISRQLAAIMGGALTVESGNGPGTTFWFTVPFLKRLPVHRAEGVEVRLAGRRVLVVDDALPSCRVVCRALRSWSIRCERAGGVAEALSLLRRAVEANDPFELAIVDMHMPDGTGVDLGRAVGADPLLRGTHLVCTTAVGQQGDGRLAEKSGFAAYLSKPFSPDELHDCVTTLLSSPEGAHGSRLVTRHSLAEKRAAACRLLVADDDPVHRALTLASLERAGHRPTMVSDGQAAIDAACRERFNLILLDLRMPVLGGLEAARIIRDPTSPVLDHDVPLVALSAQFDDEVRSRCAAVGFDAALLKPADTALFEETIERLCFKGRFGPAVFDREATLKRIGGNHQLLSELIALFLQDTATLSKELDEAVTSGDVTAVRRVAHRMLSGAVSVGATALQESLRQLETAAAADDHPATKVRLRAVQQELRTFQHGWASDGSDREGRGPGA